MNIPDDHHVEIQLVLWTTEGSHGREHDNSRVDVFCSCGWKAETYGDEGVKQRIEEHKMEVVLQRLGFNFTHVKLPPKDLNKI